MKPHCTPHGGALRPRTHKPKHKSKLLKTLKTGFVIGLVLGVSTTANALTDNIGNELSPTQAETILKTAMQDNCIPPSEHNCNPEQLATHVDMTIDLNGTTTTSCLCNTPGRAWVAETQTCEVPVCAQGEYVEMQANCGAGKYIEF